MRERQRQRLGNRNRGTERQGDRETEKQKEVHREREREKERARARERESRRAHARERGREGERERCLLIFERKTRHSERVWVGGGGYGGENNALAGGVRVQHAREHGHLLSLPRERERDRKTNVSTLI